MNVTAFLSQMSPSRESLSLREVLGTMTHLPIKQGLFCLLRGHATTSHITHP